jgi:hypothetical protein
MNIQVIRPSKHRLTGLAVVLAASMGLAQMAAAASVTRVYVIEVPPPQDHAFNVGIKAFEKCMRDHGVKHAMYAYSAETGDLSRYLFLVNFSTWGGMDAHDPALKPCDAVFSAAVMPHAGQVFSEIAVLNTKESYLLAGDPGPAPMIWAYGYRIKEGHASAFSDVVAKVAGAAAKIHWNTHFAGYDIEGAGQGGENFVLVLPNKSWADVGQDPSPSVKDMMSSVYGQAAAEAMMHKFDDAVADLWSDGWSYDKDLSLIPAK